MGSHADKYIFSNSALRYYFSFLRKERGSSTSTFGFACHMGADKVYSVQTVLVFIWRSERFFLHYYPDSSNSLVNVYFERTTFYTMIEILGCGKRIYTASTFDKLDDRRLCMSRIRQIKEGI